MLEKICEWCGGIKCKSSCPMNYPEKGNPDKLSRKEAIEFYKKGRELAKEKKLNLFEKGKILFSNGVVWGGPIILLGYKQTQKSLKD